jgi:predicted RNase H-like HicB family nuclease
MNHFAYPARFVADTTDGGFVVTFVDLPEAITQGDDLEDALHQAADCLEEAIAGRLKTLINPLRSFRQSTVLNTKMRFFISRKDAKTQRC